MIVPAGETLSPDHCRLLGPAGTASTLRALEVSSLILERRVYRLRARAMTSSSSSAAADSPLRSAPMREAWSQFYEAVNAQAVAHEGDPILTAHVLNAAAHVDPAGHWKIRKVKQSHKIDGLVAAVIAYSRAARAPAKREPLFAFV